MAKKDNTKEEVDTKEEVRTCFTKKGGILSFYGFDHFFKILEIEHVVLEIDILLLGWFIVTVYDMLTLVRYKDPNSHTPHTKTAPTSGGTLQFAYQQVYMFHS